MNRHLQYLHIIIYVTFFIICIPIYNTKGLSTPKKSLKNHSSNTISSTNSYDDLKKEQLVNPSNDFLASRFGLFLDEQIFGPGWISTNDIHRQKSRIFTSCKGRVLLTDLQGYITDGSSLYPVNQQCSWLIDTGKKNSTIRIIFKQFNTECNYDYLYIFDGNSIYSPLLAALSGDIGDFSNVLENKPVSTSTNSKKLDADSDNQALQYDQSFEIVASSGQAFLYFHSDTAQNMPGFYLEYKIDSCPLDCSSRGTCDEKTLKCTCDSGFYGDGCQYVECPNNCTSPTNGICQKKRNKCQCADGFHGPDCSLTSKYDNSRWSVEAVYGNLNEPRVFHQALVSGDVMWVVGGKTKVLSNPNVLSQEKHLTTIFLKFNLSARDWIIDEKLYGYTDVDHLAELTGHSAILFKEKIYVYGGQAYNSSTLNALTVIDTRTMRMETRIYPYSKGEFRSPMPVFGHTANIINDTIYIFLGYNPSFGYIGHVQTYNITSDSWSFIDPAGGPVEGLIGHTTNYNPSSNKVFLFGGHHSERSKHLYMFDVESNKWTFLQPAPFPRYFHSSIILQNRLIVIGGNSYNSTARKDRCFSSSILMLDIECVEKLRQSPNDISCDQGCIKVLDLKGFGITRKHGHSIVLHNSELIMFGGFNGMMLSDIHSYRIYSCESFILEEDCKKIRLGPSCYWNDVERQCITSFKSSSALAPINNECTFVDSTAIQQVCDSRASCYECVNTNLGCVWCGMGPVGHCNFETCKSSNLANNYKNDDSCYSFPLDSEYNQEDLVREADCKRLSTCYQCQTRTSCVWLNEQGCTYNSFNLTISSNFLVTEERSPRKLVFPPKQPTSTAMVPKNFYYRSPSTYRNIQEITGPQTCEAPCHERDSCYECTSSKCIWCSTSRKCIDTSAYLAYHGMGECMHYIANNLKCHNSTCWADSCSDCLSIPECGWINDKNDTGRGKCLPLLEQKLKVNTTPDGENNDDEGKWYYSTCPTCQCNGHSSCGTNSSICNQCQDNTEGLHCDRCVSGYYGLPANGGECKPCNCNDRADVCHRETGRCFCRAKGVVGHSCTRCDEQNHYVGHILPELCYYNLTTDFQYTFNLSKAEDQHIKEVNFICAPARRDLDIEFTISCSGLALVNITAGNIANRRSLQKGFECGSLRLRFPWYQMSSLPETAERRTFFFVHVYKIQGPLVFQIAFSQHRPLLLPQFFLTFSCAFLFFFALSIVIWKLKHEYLLYVRRQQQFIEMQQMASRPFATFLLDLPQSLFGKTLNSHTINTERTNDLLKSKQKKTMQQDNNEVATNYEFKNARLKSNSEKCVDEIDGTNNVSSLNEPTPISFEPCFSRDVGVVSLFVRLPGRSNLVIGSALVGLNDNITKDESQSLLFQ